MMTGSGQLYITTQGQTVTFSGIMELYGCVHIISGTFAVTTNAVITNMTICEVLSIPTAAVTFGGGCKITTLLFLPLTNTNNVTFGSVDASVVRFNAINSLSQIHFNSGAWIRSLYLDIVQGGLASFNSGSSVTLLSVTLPSGSLLMRSGSNTTLLNTATSISGGTITSKTGATTNIIGANITITSGGLYLEDQSCGSNPLIVGLYLSGAGVYSMNDTRVSAQVTNGQLSPNGTIAGYNIVLLHPAVYWWPACS